MNLPASTDYIDIHNHGSTPAPGIFNVENLMAHEGLLPHNTGGMTFTIGAHPWFINIENAPDQMLFIEKYAADDNVIALGEAGFDKLKGPAVALQEKYFTEHAILAERVSKPLFIHCVRAWDEIIAARKSLKPSMPWIIHGFRGKPELGWQLVSKGFYLSFWFDFIMRPESAVLVRSLPAERIFLETDGSGYDIRAIYSKVSADLMMTADELKGIIHNNFNTLFNLKK